MIPSRNDTSPYTTSQYTSSAVLPSAHYMIASTRVLRSSKPRREKLHPFYGSHYGPHHYLLGDAAVAAHDRRALA